MWSETARAKLFVLAAYIRNTVLYQADLVSWLVIHLHTITAHKRFLYSCNLRFSCATLPVSLFPYIRHRFVAHARSVMDSNQV